MILKIMRTNLHSYARGWVLQKRVYRGKKPEYSGDVQTYKPHSLFSTLSVFNVSALKRLKNWEGESLSVAFCS